jgi:hypothetical protein
VNEARRRLHDELEDDPEDEQCDSRDELDHEMMSWLNVAGAGAPLVKRSS